MQTFKQFLNEAYINLFTPEEKREYVDEVWDILQKSYAYAGGIKGNGFRSKEDMIQNIPFWKLLKRDGKIKSVRMYKDKDGRKAVAAGTDMTKEGIKGYKEISREDLKRAYVEVSDKALEAIKRMLGDDFMKYAIPVSIVKKKLSDDEIIPIDKYYYKREIGGHMITKIMLGNPNAKPITAPK